MIAKTIAEHQAEIARIEAKRRELRDANRTMAQQDAVMRRVEAAMDRKTAAFNEPSLLKALADASDVFAETLLAAPRTGDPMKRDEELYNEAMVHAHAIRDALNAARQGRVNARQAAKTRAATCGRCFTVHAGDECF